MNDMNLPKTSFWQLSRKIPLVIVATSAISALLIITFALIKVENIEEENIHNNFEVLTQQRLAEMDNYFDGIRTDLTIVANAPMTQKALMAFSRAWSMYDGDPMDDLPKRYINENPFPKGDKHKLDLPDGDQSAYGQVHNTYHPWFRQFLEEKGYYDIFLVNEEGKLVYSVHKEKDFATDLVNGPWKETDLALAYSKGISLAKNEQIFFDIKPYKPSGELPASFISQPIVIDGKAKGVLVFQMPISRLSAVVSRSFGLGETGEAMLVGTDGLARNKSRFQEKGDNEQRKVRGSFVSEALLGRTGITKEEFDGKSRYVGYAPFDFLGAKYALVVMQDYDEVFEQVEKIRTNLILGLGIIIAGVVVIGWLVGRSISQPISRLSILVGELARGGARSIEMQDRGDELGDMARSLNQIYGMSIENKRIRAALDNATTSIMVADSDRRVIYMNPAVEMLFRNAQSEIQKSIPHFNVDNIIGQSIDSYHKNPGVQAEILQNLTGVHTTRMKLGSRTFDLSAAAVRGSDGERLGSVVEWTDMTETLAKQEEERQRFEENYRIRVALENANTNVMVADADRDVIFTNKALQRMMSKAETEIAKDIPGFKAADILSSSIDRFHKNAHHQADILDKLTDEHPFQLKLGARTFDCVLNPIVDDQQNRLGSVIEWLDVTDELLVQQEVDRVVRAVVNGDFSKNISLEDKDGFMLGLAQSINNLKDTVSGVFDEMSTSLSSLAKGDLQYQIETDYAGTYESLKQDTNQTSSRLKQIVSDIIIASNEIAGASTEIASGSIDLSQRTENQASSLEETAASMEEMSTTVKQNADNAQQANMLAMKAREVAEEGGGVVEQAVTAMSSIEKSSQKVSDIIGVIDEIAFQTNLLALNAAVEAARAGDAGKGFAVVASEVRTLAQRSSEAAKDIKGLILDSNSQVRDGVELVGETGASLANIVESIKRVADIVSEIAAASQEQASGVGEINAAVTQMDEMTQQNAALVEESSASARSLEEQSEKMMRLMSFFDIGEEVVKNKVVVDTSASRQEITKTIEKRIETIQAPKNNSDTPDDADWEEF
ncbi:methyl-accepting chemotaxis protein [Terasakiella sp. A23]|uniref:methyl-accepting chemotaxis protein n=1 Tax=Terasakiella sp. FCG-A23 TaxID=3080561 RepID=UPI002953F08A|nr:methyl-accepting chemotaxis protein [Terasakiella sp. A23]MDV7338693.1 methyl-accepting chemotaxis protein [Terasakiella sp. A23]